MKKINNANYDLSSLNFIFQRVKYDFKMSKIVYIQLCCDFILKFKL